MLLETLRLAIEALARNRLRSLLTMLGVIIGVAAVIAMVSVGHGATAQVKAQIDRLGPNLLTLTAGQTLRGGAGNSNFAAPFEYDDVEALRREVRGLRAAAPYASSELRVVAGKLNWIARIIGTENEHFLARAWSLKAGRWFNGHEIHAGKAVCIIGETVREKLFPGKDGLGELMRLGGVPCTVIGVLAARGQAGTDADEDNVVAVPFDAFRRRIQGSPDVESISMDIYPQADAAWTRSQIRALMRERRVLGPSEADDFSILDMRQVSETMTATTSTMTSLLGAIAAVSLLVGGIGIMNIMLVSVAERTREIGVRLAIGALPGQVMAQFLIEAVVLSVGGGIIGIGVGIAVAAAAAPAVGVPLVIDVSIVLIALAVSLGLGIGFGYGPAVRAARLDPIVALRTV